MIERIIYSGLSYLTAAVHGLAVLVLGLGTVLAITGILRHRPKLEKIYYGTAFLTVLSYLLTSSCYLTTIEEWLLKRAGLRPYKGGFVSHYLKILGIFPSDKVVFWSGVVSISLGVVFYFVWHREWLKKMSGRT